MKKTGICCLVAAAMLAGAIVLNDSLAQPARAKTTVTRVGVCDIVEIFDNYQRAKDLTAQLGEHGKAIKAENEKRGKAIDAIKMELESLNPGSKEYEKRLDQIEKLTIERKAWLDYETAKSMRNHHRLTRDMHDQIVAMIALVSKELNLHIIFQRDRSKMTSNSTPELIRRIAARKVLYAAEEADITEIILSRLNLAYRSLKKP